MFACCQKESEGRERSGCCMKKDMRKEKEKKKKSVYPGIDPSLNDRGSSASRDQCQ